MDAIPEFMPVLSKGAHVDPRSGACVMEYVSLLAGEKFTDQPACTMPALARLAIAVNDGLVDGERHILVPLIPRLIGTATDDAHTCVGMAAYFVSRIRPSYLGPKGESLQIALATMRQWAHHEPVSIDEMLAATTAAATAAATAATAAVAAAAAIAAATAAAAAATATTTAAAAATAIAAAATATAAATAAAATVVCVIWPWMLHGDMLGILTEALDEFDALTGRTVSGLDTATWQQLAESVGVR